MGSAQWSVNDLRFLRSLRIAAGDPPTPTPRFHVEPGREDGAFHVVDKAGRVKDHIFEPANFADTRAAAEDFARQMNEKYVRPVKTDDDGA